MTTGRHSPYRLNRDSSRYYKNMTENNFIEVPGMIGEVCVLPAGQVAKTELLRSAGVINSIGSLNENEWAARVAKKIKDHLDAVEAARKEVKAPFFATGQEIDKAAKDHCADLERELHRLRSILGEYEKKRRDQLAEAEGALWIAQRHAEQAKSLEEVLDAESYVESSTLAVLQSAKAVKGTLREEVSVSVKDVNLLKDAYPHCVKITPDLSAIKALIDSGIKEIPGVEFSVSPMFYAK